MRLARAIAQDNCLVFMSGLHTPCTRTVYSSYVRTSSIRFSVDPQLRSEVRIVCTVENDAHDYCTVLYCAKFLSSTLDFSIIGYVVGTHASWELAWLLLLCSYTCLQITGRRLLRLLLLCSYTCLHITGRTRFRFLTCTFMPTIIVSSQKVSV